MKFIRLRSIFKYVLYITLLIVLYCSNFVNAEASPIDGTDLSWEIIPLTEPQNNEEGTAKLEISITGKGSRVLPSYVETNSEDKLAPWLYPTETRIETSDFDGTGKIIWCSDPLNESGKIKTNDGKVYKITELILPDGLLSIGENCFPYLHYLKDLIIPESVTSIGTKAFYNCKNVNEITFLNENLPNIQTNTFLDIAKEGTLYVVNPGKVTNEFIIDYFQHDSPTEVKWKVESLTNFSFFNQNSLPSLNNPIVVEYNVAGTSIDIPLDDWEKSFPVFARAKRYIGNEKFDNPDDVRLSNTGNKVFVNHIGVYLIEKYYKINVLDNESQS